MNEIERQILKNQQTLMKIKHIESNSSEVRDRLFDRLFEIKELLNPKKEESACDMEEDAKRGICEEKKQ